MTTLADSETILTFDGQRLILRPSLRAAMRLESRFGGFDKILKALSEQNIGVMSALVEECSEWPCSLADFLTIDQSRPMAFKVGALVAPLMQLTLQLAGVDEEDLVRDHDAGDGDRTSYAEHHERLFKIATGYLGWSPEVTWNATPAEIKAAYEGRLELLKSIFGTGEDKPASTSTAAPMSDASLLSFLKARAA